MLCAFVIKQTEHIFNMWWTDGWYTPPGPILESDHKCVYFNRWCPFPKRPKVYNIFWEKKILIQENTWMRYAIEATHNYVERCYIWTVKTMAKKEIENPTRKIQPVSQTASMDKCDLLSAPMSELQWLMQLVRASERSSKDPGSNPDWISIYRNV